MRPYTDSADAIKAYAEEVDFDLTTCKVTDIAESSDSRGGLLLEFDNYYNNPISITIHHNWGDLFDVTFESKLTGQNDSVYDQDFNQLMFMFNGFKLAQTASSKSDWIKKVDKSMEDYR